MGSPLPISASVDVDAPVEAVWHLVGDVTSMPRWSPELAWLRVLGRGPVAVGSRLLGLNRRGLVVWPTVSTVTRLEPGRAIAWRTRESAATWSYELAPTPQGTRLTARRDLTAYSTGTAVLGPVIGGAASHDRELAAGLETTLGRIKVAAERGATG